MLQNGHSTPSALSIQHSTVKKVDRSAYKQTAHELHTFGVSLVKSASDSLFREAIDNYLSDRVYEKNEKLHRRGNADCAEHSKTVIGRAHRVKERVVYVKVPFLGENVDKRATNDIYVKREEKDEKNYDKGYRVENRR